MTEAGVEAFLRELRTQSFGRAPVWVRETSSTIDEAEAWLRKGAPHGGVVIAERQTRGRGRQGREWASPEGGLWMSVIVRPGVEAARAGVVGLAVAVAAAQAMEEVAGCRVGLRWPNDLVAGDRKLGGVLVTGSAEAAILSLGVNVNVRLASLPEGVRESATTLLEVSGQEQPIGSLAARVLGKLEALWPSVMADGGGVLTEWGKRDVLAGKEVLIEVAGKTLGGRARGIDEHGRLVVWEGGTERAVSTGEVVSARKAAG